jgi:hypothetical protein
VLARHLVIPPKSSVGEIHDLYELDYQSLNSVQGGDPNHNGMLGAAEPWALITPRSPQHSYLLGRLEGAVPGTTMPPLATGLGDAELIAIKCWIETLDDHPSAVDPIDYDRCSFAGSVLDQAVP